MFRPNEVLLKQYYDQNPKSRATLVDFGMVPTADPLDREDWEAEVSRFLMGLARRGYRFEPAMYDGDLGLCPLYTVSLVRGADPVDLLDFERRVKQLCHPGQATTIIQEKVLEIHVLGDGQPLEEIFKTP